MNERRERSAALSFPTAVTVLTVLVSMLIVVGSQAWACERQLDRLTTLSPAELSLDLDIGARCIATSPGKVVSASAVIPAPRLLIATFGIASPASGPPPSREGEQKSPRRSPRWDVVNLPLIIELRI